MSKTDSPQAQQATITLDTPIVRGEQRIEQLVLRKPLAGELRGIALADLLRLDVGALQTVLPRITSPTLTTHDVQSMELADLVAVGTELLAFFMKRADREQFSPAA